MGQKNWFEQSQLKQKCQTIAAPDALWPLACKNWNYNLFKCFDHKRNHVAELHVNLRQPICISHRVMYSIKRGHVSKVVIIIDQCIHLAFGVNHVLSS